LIINPDDSWAKFFSISSLDENSLILDLSYHYDESSTFGARVKMKRNNSP